LSRAGGTPREPEPVPTKDGGPEIAPHFRISAGLKRILGRDLITDEFVAIFELVKNSFDAHATHVELAFLPDKIVILDDGKGMSLSDINEKWLFVAYSAKKDGSEDIDYRDKIAQRTAYAGSKGVGRFSCDRLGASLQMQTRTRGAPTQVVEVDWDDFEVNAKDEFAKVPVRVGEAKRITASPGLHPKDSGTLLEITRLRESWPREKLLKLKAALTKLISPFGGMAGAFQIVIYAPGERTADAKESGRHPEDQLASHHKIVNGYVENFIFETLRQKTTHIEVCISDDGRHLVSKLTDRGALIYHLREPNGFPKLAGSAFSCSLFFLNQSAKATFTRRMGVPSVQFGSVFLFRNDFRVFPLGEEGDDSFGIDRRKQQGFARFLGTRDVIGRIDISGSDEDFRESSSRDMGLIDTPAYRELRACFDEYCFRRLERYVVGVTWDDQEDTKVEDPSRLSLDDARTRITELVQRLAGSKGVELLSYNTELVSLLDERSAEFGASLKALRRLAVHRKDEKLLKDIEQAEHRYADLKKAELAARELADEARRLQQEAEEKVAAATQNLEEEKKRSLFLESLGGVDRDMIENLHHQIVIHAANMKELLSMEYDRVSRTGPMSKEDLLGVLERLTFQNQKVLTIARFASRANFRMDSGQIDADLVSFLRQYLLQVAPLYLSSSLEVKVHDTNARFDRRFRPIEMSMVADNLISNARRARASTVLFSARLEEHGDLVVVFEDDGRGFRLTGQPVERIFEKGFTTTEGSGLGLFHVRRILETLHATIQAEERSGGGARFVLTFPAVRTDDEA
jgi:signal transduction histidine kinase